MDIKKLKQLLDSVHSSQVSVDEALAQLKDLPYQDISYARVDHHRSLRNGFPEVIFGQGKSTEQIIGIMETMVLKNDTVMVTRLKKEKADVITKRFVDTIYHSDAKVLVYSSKPIEITGKGTILVVTAGTSDIPVAEEAAITAQTMGNHVDTLYDVGVAGIHRLIDHKESLEKASVLIVVAGMEGALPSVVGGLVDKPIIAVPTSTGYGTSFGGLTALFAMLNSCSSGIAVVNIDNGFGAGYVASLINRE
ncbi:MAG: nickel pincer cofactor biosynthesis protein LarB [Deltaproteobacteria bacterium]|nr:nickel pincer cofactor biosynthesis protein LarB [Deltaproteobacteria bacterium]